MHSFVPKSPLPDGFITQVEFTHFRRQVMAEFESLKSEIGIQRCKIQQLASEKQKQNNITAVALTFNKNQQIRKENEELKVKIQQLEQSILQLQSQKDSLQANPHPRPTLCHQFDSQQFLQQLTPSITSLPSAGSLGDSPFGSTSKCILDDRPTNQNQQAAEDEDEELIQCVWEDRSSQDQKAEISNNQKYPHNPHNNLFTIQRKKGRISISKNTGDNFLSPAHNFIHRNPLQKGSKITVRVRMMRVKDVVMVGVCSLQILGVQNAFRHKEVCVFSSNGDVWCRGDSKRTGKQLKEGQVVEMTVDRSTGVIFWSVQGKIAGKVDLPKQMIQRQLYVTVMMFNKGDMVELEDWH